MSTDPKFTIDRGERGLLAYTPSVRLKEQWPAYVVRMSDRQYLAFDKNSARYYTYKSLSVAYRWICATAAQKEANRWVGSMVVKCHVTIEEIATLDQDGNYTSVTLDQNGNYVKEDTPCS